MSAKARTTRRKGKTYAQLKRELDAVVSQFVRRSAVDANGLVQCITCRKPYPVADIQCGHFISRVHLSSRWEARNLAPQCYACNVLRRGNVGEFALYLNQRYGPNIIAELVEKKRESIKFTRADLQAKIDHYKSRLETL